MTLLLSTVLCVHRGEREEGDKKRTCSRWEKKEKEQLQSAYLPSFSSPLRPPSFRYLVFLPSKLLLHFSKQEDNKKKIWCQFVAIASAFSRTRRRRRKWRVYPSQHSDNCHNSTNTHTYTSHTYKQGEQVPVLEFDLIFRSHLFSLCEFVCVFTTGRVTRHTSRLQAV